MIEVNNILLTLALQAYTSQFVALIMFALLMCDDRISMQPRRREIIQGLRVLPGKQSHQKIKKSKSAWKNLELIWG